ncbi:MAG TPA: hypothetical protein VLY03_04950 [Bacteroidota bacterium]|nr:hypothetical protein [Bacteroidota bacterium]
MSLLFLVSVGYGRPNAVPINFQHLQNLTERILLAGDSVDIVHIYSNYPSYQWTAAAESGEEGIACVDDAARAALLYIRYFDLTGDTSALNHVRGLIAFVQHMETTDGMFYNFIHADHSINADGRTSYKSFGWWGVRGMWCLSAAYRVFRNRDSVLAASLRIGIVRTFPHIDSLLKSYNTFKAVKGYRVPQWLLYGSGSDVTSALILGLSEYYQATHDRNVGTYIRKFAQGLITMQDGNLKTAPYGLHRSWETMWHMWGNDQTAALAVAGKLLRDRRMISSGELEAQGFFSRLLIEGFRKEIDISSDTSVKEFDQIAYGIRPMVSGLLRLYDATRNSNYRVMAGLAASWLFGDNAAHAAMYDSATGICFDGIRDSATINKNSGAESTIEALWTLVDLGFYPQTRPYLHFSKLHVRKTPEHEFATFGDSAGDEVSVILDLRRGTFSVLEGEESKLFRMRNR